MKAILCEYEAVNSRYEKAFNSTVPNFEFYINRHMFSHVLSFDFRIFEF